MRITDLTSAGGAGEHTAQALVVPTNVAAAEQRVVEIRRELATANAALNRAIQEHLDVAHSGRASAAHVRAVHDAEAVVAGIEARLRAARADMEAARLAWSPRFAAATATARRAAGADLEAAAEHLERALGALTAIHSFRVRHGLASDRLLGALPRPRDLRAVAARLLGAAR